MSKIIMKRDTRNLSPPASHFTEQNKFVRRNLHSRSIGYSKPRCFNCCSESHLVKQCPHRTSVKVLPVRYVTCVRSIQIMQYTSFSRISTMSSMSSIQHLMTTMARCMMKKLSSIKSWLATLHILLRMHKMKPN